MSKFKPKSPQQKEKERLAIPSNQHEAVDHIPTGWWGYRSYSTTDSKDFGMHSKRIRRQRK